MIGRRVNGRRFAKSCESGEPAPNLLSPQFGTKDSASQWDAVWDGAHRATSLPHASTTCPDCSASFGNAGSSPVQLKSSNSAAIARDTEMRSLSIVIPALNEAENIPTVMSTIPRTALKGAGWDVEV